jgi:hypothetical protein
MIKVHLQPRPTRARRADKVFGVFSFRYDAHLVPGLLANIEPLVDGWVSYDDRGSRCEFSDEPARRHLLLEAAKSAGAQWALVADPDERFETRLVDAIDSLVSAKGQIAYAFAVRELFTPNAYRVDGLWGRKSQTKLFRLPRRLAASPSPLHSPWHELVPGVQLRESGFNLYHLKMITPERRRARRAVPATRSNPEIPADRLRLPGGRPRRRAGNDSRGPRLPTRAHRGRRLVDARRQR